MKWHLREKTHVIESLQKMTFSGTENYSWENINLYFIESIDKAVSLQGANSVNGKQNLQRWNSKHTQKIYIFVLKVKTDSLKSYTVCSKFHFIPKWNYILYFMCFSEYKYFSSFFFHLFTKSYLKITKL